MVCCPSAAAHACCHPLSAQPVALVVGVPGDTLLGCYLAEAGESALGLVERVAAAMPTIEAAAAEAVAAAEEQSAAAALAAENAELKRQLEELQARSQSRPDLPLELEARPSDLAQPRAQLRVISA